MLTTWDSHCCAWWFLIYWSWLKFLLGSITSCNCAHIIYPLPCIGITEKLANLPSSFDAHMLKSFQLQEFATLTPRLPLNPTGGSRSPCSPFAPCPLLMPPPVTTWRRHCRSISNAVYKTSTLQLFHKNTPVTSKRQVECERSTFSHMAKK